MEARVSVSTLALMWPATVSVGKPAATSFGSSACANLLSDKRMGVRITRLETTDTVVVYYTCQGHGGKKTKLPSPHVYFKFTLNFSFGFMHLMPLSACPLQPFSCSLCSFCPMTGMKRVRGCKRDSLATLRRNMSTSSVAPPDDHHKKGSIHVWSASKCMNWGLVFFFPD